MSIQIWHSRCLLFAAVSLFAIAGGGPGCSAEVGTDERRPMSTNARVSPHSALQC